MQYDDGILGCHERERAEARAQQQPFSLAGEVALVTGACGRLGQHWIRALEDAGCDIVVATDTDEAMHGDSPFRHTIPNIADISRRADVERLLTNIRSCHGTPTIVVNNAGVDSRPFMKDYDAMTEAMVQCNLRGTDLMLQIFGEAMAQVGYGSIINIASLYGLVSPDLRYYDHRDDGWIKDPMYGATKAGVIGLTRYYAAKWAQKGVRVNALAPGGIVAPGDGLTAQDPRFVEKYTSRIPMGRMCSPDDLSGPLVFLASKASSFVTGQVLALDGGYLAW